MPLKAGATISQTVSAVGSTSNPTTNSGTLADLAEMTVTLTTRGGNLECTFEGTVSHTTATSVITCAYVLDAGAAVGSRGIVAAVNGGSFQIILSHLFTSVSAGSHTVKVQWSTSAATATAVGGNRELIVREVAA